MSSFEHLQIFDVVILKQNMDLIRVKYNYVRISNEKKKHVAIGSNCIIHKISECP